MYSSFFGLNEKPFSITPDPRYLYMSQRHTEALAHLIYGVKESGGFIQLTGEVGTGKTTLVRSLLQQLPESADVALILNSQLSKTEFLDSICEELGIPSPQPVGSTKALTDALNDYLLENHSNGRRTILIVDEAQNLQTDVLEQVRLLTNLETTKQKLLQIILIGQPELRELLSRNDMRQLAQRITGRYHLEPLSAEETTAYIDHRLKVAGCTLPVFPIAAKKAIYRLSKGIPRIINVVADRALLGAFTKDMHQVTPDLVREAADEIYGHAVKRTLPMPRFARYAAATLVGVLLAGIFGTAGYPRLSRWMNGTADTSGIITLANNQRQTTAPTAIDTQQSPAANETPKESGQEPLNPGITAPGIINPGTINSAPPNAGPVSLEALLQEKRQQTGNEHAFRTLFGLWNVEFASGSTRACDQAAIHNLYCLSQRGSLSQIRVLDRPAILTLRDALGNRHQVVLSGLEEAIAFVWIGSQRYDIDTTELADLWFGEYLLLWRPEIGVRKALLPGMQDQDVRWLRESLAKIQGTRLAPIVSDLYDQELENSVRDYQRERRLTVDGLVGQQTQIAINTDLDPTGIPRLVRVN